MPRRQDRSVTGTISAAFDKVIADYPLLVLHAAFILGVMLGQQTAKSRFSVMSWAKKALPDSPRVMAAALPFARRTRSARRKPGRRKSTRQAMRGPGRPRRQAKAAAAA
jgi:hypothetical protein